MNYTGLTIVASGIFLDSRGHGLSGYRCISVPLLSGWHAEVHGGLVVKPWVSTATWLGINLAI